MSVDRKSCYDSIVKNSGVTVELVTLENLQSYNVDNTIHPSFEYLSATHKSDYLRSYFMFHHGGGYSDIKHCDYDWNKYFNDLDLSNKDFIGYAERSPRDIAYRPAEEMYKNLVGNCSYIFKKQTPFAKLWFEETTKKMDSVSENLKLYPGDYHERAIKGGIHGASGHKDSKYPLEWNELLGRIFHKICSENLNSFLNHMPRISQQRYR